MAPSSTRRSRSKPQPGSKTTPRQSKCKNDSSDDDDDMPPLVDDENQTNPIQEIEDDADEDDDLSDQSKCCLHCHTEATEVQVRCDECNSYICQDCHWCHEFQANHEIRVCDRCDAFYCRKCDEMDQCDDCAEVVCASCSTLLSCKFCGGGLCEDCATACGRCGIVLCSRDAKFAVDCDTCRLSYCLVCLASGSKDPCVRCGHRPSKRMEQLVHLRLKSIYKAFKQNSSGKSSSKEAEDMADDPESLLQAAATAAKHNPAAKKKHGSVHHGTSSSSAAHQHHSHIHARKRSNTADGSVDSTQDKVNRYKEEKEKADAAAAALLAELEEEEEAETKKKSKKKKKKARQQAKKEEEERKSQKDDPSAAASSERIGDDDDDDFSMSDRSMEDKKPSSKSRKKNVEPEPEVKPEEDPLEKEYVSLVEDEDEEGLEQLLASIKGVPGRAVLRKNAKKALKRLRLANMPDVEEEVASHSEHQPEPEIVSDEPKKASRATPETPTKKFVDTNGFLTIVSHSHNKPSAQNIVTGAHANNVRLRSECVMHMAPMIVGWVIGKGGVRIRDLMEESGARVWIDQDSMGPGDPRTVYVSGSRKSVEMAVEMIQELVSQAPYSPSGVRQTTPVAVDATTASGKGKSASKLPQQADSGKPSASLKAKNGTQSDGRSKQILTCEPRFVPLLIGRRGWTIKNIQDSTGAKVDIDQTVNPRKITISGPEDHIERAVRMVRDVLSYPHAQLQGTAAEEAAAAETAAREKAEAAAKEQAEAAAAAKVAVAAPVPPPSSQVAAATTSQLVTENIGDPPKTGPTSPVVDPNNRSGATSPPSSLIMTGDAKSTISASSSLSSTPEPSMTSVKASTAIQQPAPTGPIMSPAQSREMFTGDALQNPFARPQMPPPSPMAGPLIYSAGNALGAPGDPLFGGKTQQPVGHLDPNPSMGTPLRQIVGDRSSFQTGEGPGAFGSMPTPPLQPRGGGFHQPGFSPVRSGSTDLHQPTSLFGNDQSGNPANAPSTLWDRAGPAGGITKQPGQEGYHIGAAVDFLEHSKKPTSMPSTIGPGNRNDVIAVGGQNPSIEQSRGTSAPDPLTCAQGRNDAQIIESLFGPPQGGAGNNGSSLLSGLQGLSISNSSGENTARLWSSSEHRDDGGLPPVGGAVATQAGPSGNSLLFASSGLATESKPHSRFAWGESGNA